MISDNINTLINLNHNKDQIDEFEKKKAPVLINEDDESFESLMTIADGMKPPKESKQSQELVDQDKVLDTRR